MLWEVSNIFVIGIMIVYEIIMVVLEIVNEDLINVS